MPHVADYLLNNIAIIPNTWARIVNNQTSTAYVSDAATTANGLFTFLNVVIPAGVYTVYSGPTNAGPWTPTGNTNYVVAPSSLNVFNVLDYGALGDGATDDATAINAAITAAGTTGIVYFPAATYVIKSTLVPPTAGGQTWQGYGATLQWQGGTNSLMVQNSNVAGTVFLGFGIQGLTFDAHNISGVTPLLLQSWTGGWMQDITIDHVTGGSTPALRMENNAGTGGVNNSTDNIIRNLHIRTAPVGITMLGQGSGSTGNFVTNNSFHGLTMDAIQVCGIRFVQWCDSNNFHTCRIALNSNNATAVIFNDSGSPTLNKGVYNERFYGLGTASFGITGATGLFFNYSKQILIEGYYHGPDPFNGTLIQDNHLQAISYYIAMTDNDIDNNILVKSKNWYQYNTNGNLPPGDVDVANVMAYGAIGNNINDDTTAIQAAINAVSTALVQPTISSLQTATTGGTIAGNATYYYKITATNPFGETAASIEASIAVPAGTNTNTVTVNWTQVDGASNYKIFGRATGTEGFISFAAGALATSYVDTGSPAPGAAPTTINTTSPGGIVYFPPGFYRISASLIPAANMTLQGGQGVTISWIGAAPGSPTYLLDTGDPGAGLNVTKLFVKDIIFDTRSVNNVHGVRLISWQYGGLDHVWIKNASWAGGEGLRLDAISGSTFVNNNAFNEIWHCRIISCDTAIVFKGASANVATTDNDFYATTCGDIISKGISFVQWCDSNRFYGFRVAGRAAANTQFITVNDSATPAADVGVYDEQFYGLFLDGAAGGAGQNGFVLNWSYSTKSVGGWSSIGPGGSPGSYVVDNNSQSHDIELLSGDIISGNATQIHKYTKGAVFAGPTDTSHNYIKLQGVASGSSPVISTLGKTDANVDLTLTPKGSGLLRIPAGSALDVSSAGALNLGRTTATSVQIGAATTNIGIGGSGVTQAGVILQQTTTASAGNAHAVLLQGTLAAAVNGDGLRGLTFSSSLTFATGTFTGLVAYGVFINASTFSTTGSGTISNAYGLNISTPTIGTTNFGLYINGTSATTFTVASTGTNYALKVDTSTASAVTGLAIKAAAAGGGLALSTINGNAAENLTFDARGAGTIGIGTVSTGAITLGRATTVTTGGLTVSAGPVIGNASVDAFSGAITITVDGTKGNTHTIAATSNTASTLTPSGAGVAGQHMWIIITADGTGGNVITFASTFKPNGTLTTTANKGHTVHFISNGTNWYEVARTLAL